MAFASGGGVGTANEKTSDRSISVTLTGSVAVDDLLAVFFACDNDFTVNTDSSAFNQGVACTDSQGNIYSQVYSQNTNAATAAASRGALFVTRPTTALTTSDTVTVSINEATVAKAASLHRFTMDTSQRWAVVNTQPANATTLGADPAALTLSSLTSKPYLLLHVLAGEGPQTDAYTWDTDYTQITGDGTTGGADDTNIHVRGGFRIATLTTDTVDVTSTTADRDYVQGFVALCEVAYDSTFPPSTAPIVDDFNRADEDPLSNGGLWHATGIATVAGAPPGSSNPGDVCKLVSTRGVVRQTAHIDNNSGSFIAATTAAGVDQDVYATCSTIPTNSSTPQGGGSPNTNPGNRGFGVIISGPFDMIRDGLADGFEAKWERPGRIFNPDFDRIRFGDPQSFTVLPYVTVWANMANGTKVGLQRRGLVVHLWIDQGSGWRWVAAIDDKRGSMSTGFTHFGLDIGGTETRVVDFGAGPGLGVVDDFVPQIIRRLHR